MPHDLDPTQLTPLRGLRPTLARLWLRLQWPWLQRRYRRLTIERIGETPLLVLPDVFNAALFRGGELLAQELARTPLLARTGLRVLDLGSGTGVVSVFAARRGAMVTAVDINPAAVRCTRINALLNQVEERIEARLGDLFAPVTWERFDLIVFNPPFYRGRPQDMPDHAWRGETVFERFAAGLAAHLRPEGRAWLLLSTDGDGADLLGLLAQAGFQISVLRRRRWSSEIMSIYEIRPPAKGE